MDMSTENSQNTDKGRNTPKEQSQEVLSAQSLKDVFGEALSEDVKEIEEFSAKEPEIKTTPKPAKVAVR